MMPKKGNSAAGPFLALVCISMIWGYNWVVMKESLKYAGSFDFNALRMVLGSVFLFAFMAWKREPLRPPYPLWTAMLGIIQTAFGTGLIVWALESGGAGKTSVLVYTMPFWILLLAWYVLNEKVQGAFWVPIILAFCGLILILEPWALRATTQSKILAVLSGVCWACGAVIVKILGRGRKLDLIRLTTWQLIFGALPLVPLAFFTPSQPIEWSPYFIGSIAYNSILVCGVAFLLWTYVLDRLPAGIAGLGTLAVPVIGMTGSRIQLGEEIAFWEGWGIALIVTALALLSIIRLREPRKEAVVPGQD
jgi:drug/metabolite transporter (DMT)-like permease